MNPYSPPRRDLNRPLCCDGAMGTLLIARGLTAGASGMLWNIDKPENVCSVHDAYRTAGCDLITTNSFGGSAFALRAHGLVARGAELYYAAATLARAAAGENGMGIGRCRAVWRFSGTGG